MDAGDQFVGSGGDDRNVRIQSPDDGSFQFSQMPAMPNGAPSFIAIA
jgi:hypothetical protein